MPRRGGGDDDEDDDALVVVVAAVVDAAAAVAAAVVDAVGADVAVELVSAGTVAATDVADGHHLHRCDPVRRRSERPFHDDCHHVELLTTERQSFDRDIPCLPCFRLTYPGP